MRSPFCPRTPFLQILLATLCASSGLAAEDGAAAAERSKGAAAAPIKRGAEMDYGSLLCSMLALPGKAPDRIVARKGVIVRLASDSTVCFDPDTLRYAAGWKGAFLDLSQTNIGSYKGEGLGAAMVAGELSFRTEELPGWSLNGRFADPSGTEAGTTDASTTRYLGFYRHGERVIFSYRFADCDILDSPAATGLAGSKGFLRQISIGPSKETLHLSLPRELGLIEVTGADLQVQSAGEHRSLLIPPHEETLHFTLHLLADQPLPAPPTTSDLRQLAGGATEQWPAITMAGKVAKDSTAYVVDSIPVPEENPCKSWMRLTALDFLPDGRAAVSTLNGDVWLVSGLDEKLEQVVWKRFATGLFEPLGLKVQNDRIYVLGRDQITRLHDRDSDGEADFYECFNHDRAPYPSYHAFAFDLQADSAGNLYYSVGGNQLGQEREWHASLYKVSADGAKTDVIATGFRAPNGLAVSSDGQIVVSDNQGQWIPASKINLIKPGGFYGHVADPRIAPDAVPPPGFDPPLCWIPMTIDNSSGGQVWGSSERWGPFGKHLLHTSYGQSALFAVLQQRVGIGVQGGVVKFPLKFGSGIMRARFNPLDGQLYVAGLRGWQTNAARDGSLERVRFTGGAVYLPTALEVGKESITIGFPSALDRSAAADPESYSVSHWNYRWHAEYGSPDIAPSDPSIAGRETLEVSAATLSEDQLRVTLHVPGLQPVMQMVIDMRLQAADGTQISTQVANTIHEVP